MCAEITLPYRWRKTHVDHWGKASATCLLLWKVCKCKGSEDFKVSQCCLGAASFCLHNGRLPSLCQAIKCARINRLAIYGYPLIDAVNVGAAQLDFAFRALSWCWNLLWEERFCNTDTCCLRGWACKHHFSKLGLEGSALSQKNLKRSVKSYTFHWLERTDTWYRFPLLDLSGQGLKTT